MKNWKSLINNNPFIMAENEDDVQKQIEMLVRVVSKENINSPMNKNFEQLYRMLSHESWQIEDRHVKKKWLGTQNPRKCALCNKTVAEVTFNDNAHVISKLLGNNWLYTFDECDDCNKSLGKTIENEFGRFILPAKALGRLPGETKTAKFKLGDGRSVIGGQNRGESLRVELQESDKSISIAHSDSSTIDLTIGGLSFRPKSVTRAILKMMWHLLPEEERNQYDVIREMVRGEFDVEKTVLHRWFIPGPGFARVGMAVWKKIESNTEIPDLVCMLYFSNDVLIWQYPNIQSKKHEIGPFPALLKSQYPPHFPQYAGIEAETDDKVHPTDRYTIQGESFLLMHSANPVDITLKVKNTINKSQALNANLIAKNDAGSPQKVKYEISGGDLCGKMEISIHADEPNGHLTYEFDASHRSVQDGIQSADFFLALDHDATLTIVENLSGKPLLVTQTCIPRDISEKIKNMRLILGWLAVINENIQTDIRFDETLNSNDIRTIELIAAGITHGSVKETPPTGGVIAVSLTHDAFTETVKLLRDGAKTLGGMNVMPFYVRNQLIDPGPVSLNLVDVSFVKNDVEIEKEITNWGNEKEKNFEIRCKYFIYDFKRWMNPQA